MDSLGNDLGAMLVVLGVVFFLVAIFALVVYIFTAIGLSKIANGRGMPGFLAWIPLANTYLIGAVADDINWRGKGQKTYYGLILLIASLVSMVVTIPVGIAAGEGYTSTYMTMMMVTYAISLGLIVINCIAMYQIYNDYAPDSAVLYLILSILFGLSWVFIFIIRNKPSRTLAAAYGYSDGGYAPPPSGGGYTPPPNTTTYGYGGTQAPAAPSNPPYYTNTNAPAQPQPMAPVPPAPVAPPLYPTEAPAYPPTPVYTPPEAPVTNGPELDAPEEPAPNSPEF